MARCPINCMLGKISVSRRHPRTGCASTAPNAAHRLFLRLSALLFLDEATSALDNLNEKAVQDAIERTMDGRTVIAVAHCLSILRNADRVLVMDAGRIVESGSYTNPAKSNGLFSRLVSAGEERTISLTAA